jgi:hypothetical protein
MDNNEPDLSTAVRSSWAYKAYQFNAVMLLCAISALVIDEVVPELLMPLSIALSLALLLAIMGDAFFFEKMRALGRTPDAPGSWVVRQFWPPEADARSLWLQPAFWGLICGKAFVCFYCHLPNG